jgi:hypothetical protein
MTDTPQFPTAPPLELKKAKASSRAADFISGSNLHRVEVQGAVTKANLAFRNWVDALVTRSNVWAVRSLRQLPLFPNLWNSPFNRAFAQSGTAE